MNGIIDPARIISQLVALDDAGWLADYEQECAEANRGPARDLDRYPHLKIPVDQYAKTAARIFGGDVQEWREAACEALLPSTRRLNNLAILDEHCQRLEDKATTDGADAALARSRGRRQK